MSILRSPGTGAIGIVLVLLLVLGLSLVPGSELPAADSAPDSVLQQTLVYIGLQPSDLTIPPGVLEDPLRFRLTKDLLERPLTTGAVMESFAASLHEPTGRSAMQLAAAQMGIVDVVDRVGPIVDPSVGFGSLSALNPDVRAVIAPLVVSLLAAKEAVSGAVGPIPEGHSTSLRNLHHLVMRDVQITEAEREALLTTARRIDIAAMVYAAGLLSNAAAQANDTATQLPASTWPHSPVVLETRAGSIVVGSPGDDTYDTPSALILDPAGDDTYSSCAAVATDLPASVSIDLSGNDRYSGLQATAQAGVAVLLDGAGADVYEAGDRAQGCGIAGIAILDDVEGDDAYTAGVVAQGFGLFGIGILCDRDGVDTYSAQLLAQGVGAPRGIGLLADGGGDDSYTAGGRYRDFRQPPSYQSMSQGFGYGIRPTASGGIGILYDGQGNDSYRAEIFAQGSAHWGAAGFLVDMDGDDRYIAHRFAQGCGSHSCVGGLLDAAGDDRYTIWGVGQGCGHDVSVGVLVERRGNDTYTASQLAQGAARANGIGILDDAAGDDVYIGKEGDTQGYGYPARHHGSVGLLLDRRGSDRFEGPGKKGRFWVGGTYGVGMDYPPAELLTGKPAERGSSR